ncbi:MULTISPECIES: inositol monophosphatase family protein [Marinomonas]|uniref:Inositol monophosphatase n=1 Tax=Marinomonas arctica TaxID=383750 RepID=A0A7H1J3I5_9GAMM|nr:MULTISPECIES: inositol monophosphatase family protein [Marinomonas]MCS7486024.1 inositol monophosphatase [Marinomonas sp. BSi20414]QNT05051.1 inositol monophosphatase [Marinomonas arctica]GGN16509.1 inositol-1-monophosphatase [Marinomonas arctica]
MQPRINVALKAARAAAEYIVHSQEKLLFDKEQGQSAEQVYQTVCSGAERSIVYYLEKAYPADTITTRLQGTVQNGNEGEWIIDAIQGQHLFSRGLTGNVITMSYLVAGKVEHALVLNPHTKDEFYASKGRGAYLNNSRIRSSSARTLEKVTVAAQFPATDRLMPYLSGQFAVLTEIAEQGARAVMQDCPALMLANVAAGRLDAAWGIKLQEWEMQAPLFIAKEAGCLFAGFDGSPSIDKGDVLCAAPRLFKVLLPTLNKHLN